jgi:hypothetical protein
MAVGYKLYTIAIFSTVLAILILFVMWGIEHTLIKKLPIKPREPHLEAEDEDL